MTKETPIQQGDDNTISVAIRQKAGSAATRSVRLSGMVPGVVYGGKEDPELISLDPRSIMKQLHRGAIKATLFVLDINGKKQEAVVKDCQLNLLNELPSHIDFQRVVGDSVIPIMVPVRFINADICVGIKNGGVLTVVRNDVELLCKPHAIPKFIEVDLTDFKMGQAIKISHVVLPDGVTPVIKHEDFPIATIAAPRGMDVDADIASEKMAETAATAAVDGEAPAEGEETAVDGSEATKTEDSKEADKDAAKTEKK
ncbi:MAG: 50S ribosomal protein L25/general stress protein Ctc [Alphaproteobacteria bacterium]